MIVEFVTRDGVDYGEPFDGFRGSGSPGSGGNLQGQAG